MLHRFDSGACENIRRGPVAAARRRLQGLSCGPRINLSTVQGRVPLISDTPAKPIRLLVLDVDGVLTDGQLAFGTSGETGKIFSVLDGAAMTAWQRAGGVIAIISGRFHPAVDARARELSVKLAFQGVTEKGPVYQSVCERLGVTDGEVAVVGDDVGDLPMLRRCGYPIATANAVPAAKRAARYITRRLGGHGAVWEAIGRLMRMRNHQATAVSAAVPT